MNTTLRRISVTALFATAVTTAPAMAAKRYGPGATDTEIKIGNIMPYTGIFSEYGAIGRAEAAYFQMINDLGGVNGRKINFVSLDNASDVSRDLALAEELIEQDKVLLVGGTWGTTHSMAVRAYLNEKKVPQLFIASPSSKFADPAEFPWSMGFQASSRTEGQVYAKYILRIKPDAKIAVLYGDNEDSNEWLLGVHEGLGEEASSMIVGEASFTYSDPTTLDPQIATLKSSGANVFINFAVGKFATQAIRKAYDIDWHPLQFIPNASLSISAFLDPAGLEKAVGIVSNARSKGWSSPEEKRDPAAHEFLEWMKKYNPSASDRDANNVYGYEVAQTLVEVLRKCGDDLTRANVMKQATSLDLELGMLRPGIRVTTTSTDYRPIKQLYLIKFDGKHWIQVGEVIGD